MRKMITMLCLEIKKLRHKGVKWFTQNYATNRVASQDRWLGILGNNFPTFQVLACPRGHWSDSCVKLQWVSLDPKTQCPVSPSPWLWWTQGPGKINTAPPSQLICSSLTWPLPFCMKHADRAPPFNLHSEVLQGLYFKVFVYKQALSC